MSTDFIIERKVLKTVNIWPNTGQITGLPKNPRYIKDDKFEKLKQSIINDPEFLEVRELVVIPYAGDYVIIGGNMRFRACVELQIKEVPCKILPENTPVEKLKAFLMKDNIGYGSTDWDLIANEWDEDQLLDWGFDLPLSFIEPESNDSNDEFDDDEINHTSNSSGGRIMIELKSDFNKELIKAHIQEVLKDYPEASIK